jgi:hypothetical protein
MVTVVNVSYHDHEKQCLNVGLLQIAAADVLVTCNRLRHRTSVTLLNTLKVPLNLLAPEIGI